MLTPRSITLHRAACYVALSLFAAFGLAAAFDADAPGAEISHTLPLAAGALAPAFGRRDAALTITRALPNGAAAVSSDPIDLQHSVNGSFLANCEFEILAPAMNTTQMPNDKTMIYQVEHDTDPAFGTVATLLPAVITQTGVGGAGCAAATFRFRVPAGVKRYLRVTATGSASGNATTASLTFQPRF